METSTTLSTQCWYARCNERYALLFLGIFNDINSSFGTTLVLVSQRVRSGHPDRATHFVLQYYIYLYDNNSKS